MEEALEVTGQVAQPGTFDFAALAQLPGQIDDISTLMPGRRGGGVRLSALLEAVQPQPGTTHLTVELSDGTFSASVPLGAVAQSAVVLYRLGSQALPAQHGGPFRFLITDAVACATGDIDTCANVKFVGRLSISFGLGRDTRPLTARSRVAMHARGRRQSSASS